MSDAVQGRPIQMNLYSWIYAGSFGSPRGFNLLDTPCAPHLTDMQEKQKLHNPTEVFKHGVYQNHCFCEAYTDSTEASDFSGLLRPTGEKSRISPVSVTYFCHGSSKSLSLWVVLLDSFTKVKFQK